MQEVSILSETSKLVVCMIAMGLSKCSEVQSKLKGFVADTNRQCKGKDRAFSGHGNASNEELLDLVTAYIIGKKLVTITDPPPLTSEGVQKLFPENVVKENIV